MQLVAKGRLAGKNNPMYGIRLFGEENPFYGRKHSEETKKKMRGRKHSPETIIKMSINRRGKSAWNKDLIMKDNAGYNATHTWVRNRKIKPDFCEECGIAPPFDLANINGKYLRDLKDWQYLCRKCHQISDGRINRRDPKTGRFKAL